MGHEKPEPLEHLKDLHGTYPQDTGVLTVYYDGSCPLCDREIKFYRTMAGSRNVTWRDVTSVPSNDLIDGPSRQAALRRFHVRTAEGELLSGAAAFSKLWLSLPGWRLLGAITGNRIVLPFAEAAYRLFLLIRPAVQVLVRKVGDG